MSSITVTDPADPRLAAYRDIKERDFVGRQGCFIAEGEVVLRLLLRSQLHQTLSVLIAEHRWPTLAPMLETIAAPVYLASQPVLDEIAGFNIHRGILAIGRPLLQPSAKDLLGGLGGDALVVCLFGIGNHDNMGGLFRNAAAFGADAILLAADCCDPMYRKAIRVSVGASLTVPFARFEADVDAIGLLEAEGFQRLALSPSGDLTLSEVRRARRTAALFGSEGPGLAQQVMSRATTVRIPMAGDFDSLNVATSSGIVLHHLASQRSGGTPKPQN